MEGVLNGGEVKNGSDPVSGALSYSQKFSLLCFSLDMFHFFVCVSIYLFVCLLVH